MDWTTWQKATCLPDCWCEATRTGSWILEPVNTWTNLIYLFAGLIFIYKAQDLTTHSNKLNSLILFPRLYGFAMIFLGLGSFFYHASQTFVGQWFDVFGMYLISMFYIFYNFYRVDHLSIKYFLFFYFVSCLFLGLIIFFLPETRRWLFGVSIVFALIQSIWIQVKSKSAINVKNLAAALCAYLFAQTTWILDKNKIWCDPYAWMNGHGIWHVFTGVAAISTYLYFRSERSSKQLE